MLYSLCMKFQDQLENRVLCKTFSSRRNSEVHPSVTTHEELKMYLDDIITNISHQFSGACPGIRKRGGGGPKM